MITNLLPLLASAVISIEGNDMLAIGSQGERGYGQGKQVMLDEVERATGIKYHPHVWYSRAGTINVMMDYWRGWRREINGRIYTVRDLRPGQVAVLWGCGPGGMDKRIGRRDGPYARRAMSEFGRIRERKR